VTPTRSDISAAAARMGNPKKFRREVEGLERWLRPGEQVLRMTSGILKSHGLLVLTNQRLLFVAESRTSTKVEDIELTDIVGVDWRPGFGSGSLGVIKRDTTVKFSVVDKESGGPVADMLRDPLAVLSEKPRYIAAAPPSPAFAAPATPSTMSVGDRLAQLDGLLYQGLITQQEHAAKRQAIIDSL
jgi:hypothetical protein